MGRVLVVGLAGAVRRWPVVLLLWAVGALFGLAFSIAAGHWLDQALEASLATRTLLQDLSLNLLIELWHYHRESLTLLLAVGAVLGLTQLAVTIALNAGVAGTAQDARAAVTWAEFWKRAFGLYPVFARLWLLATAAELLVLGGLASATWLGVRWLAESPDEMARYYLIAAATVVGGPLLLLLVTIHDHARLYAARKGGGALQAMGWAGWFVVRGDARAFLLALVLVALGGAGYLLYRSVVMFVPATSAFGVTVSLLWGQVLLQSRALLRVTAFVAESELQAELLE
ncbi:MAG: hypothetical protein HY699_15390 [Deltaproteobacteria bacterium]|nr:hypothetical protein [Deltaproteobacteria bacterium]